MSKIVLFDVIGINSGCRYYDEAFYNLLKKKNLNVELVSNFSITESVKPYMVNIYKGGKLRRLYNVLVFFFQYLLVLIKFRKSTFVYMTYGEPVDFVLLLIARLFVKRLVVDTHEYIALDKEKNHRLFTLLTFVYGKANQVIYHAPRTKLFLRNSDLLDIGVYAPHFKYNFDKNYRIEHISEEMKGLFDREKINVLFFGHLRASKGVDLVLDALNVGTISSNYNIIFAGKDTDNKYKEVLTRMSHTHTIKHLLRFIEDEELNFLFDNSDLLLLPYKEVSQSGVLETAVYFRKQMVLSRIDYFENFNQKFHSLSYLIDNSSDSLIELFSKIDIEGIKPISDKDIDKFYSTDEYEELVKYFISTSNKIC